MTGEHVIHARDLNVYYGQLHVLKDITVAIPRSKITAIIGPSGCGKSTLLRSFNRLLETMDNVRLAGSVRLGPQDVYAPGVDVTLIRKKMGLLAQRPFPLPMSIYENVAFGPRLHGIRNRRALDRLVEDNLQLTGLWSEVRDRLHTPAVELSIGQQQRLCLARGLAVEPEVILADEPTSALDPQSSRRIEECFRHLKDRYSIVMVTHILRQARRLADYILFLYMGELVEHGPAEQMFNAPRRELTREYVQGVIS
ncbi:MAG: phosphate ABC transporter ATP-binding protein [Acidobacteria bacterium]|nr:phosphate ABC transporter ATP-binding protein [Acidobacteriota bacterium]